MPEFSDFKKLENYILSKISQAVESVAVEDVFSDAMQESVEEVVYDAYEPRGRYERRENNGGLSDVRNMSFTSTSFDGKTFISDFENLTVGQDSMKGNYISELIEEGSNNILTGEGNKENGWYSLGEWSKPRPFAQETANKLDNTGLHNTKLKDVLEREINK